MSQDEEIDLLRRELADLRERVAKLEQRPPFPIPTAAAPQVPTPFYVGTIGGKDCGCPLGVACSSLACPRKSRLEQPQHVRRRTMIDVDETFRLWAAKPDAPAPAEPIPALKPTRPRRTLPRRPGYPTHRRARG